MTLVMHEKDNNHDDKVTTACDNGWRTRRHTNRKRSEVAKAFHNKDQTGKQAIHSPRADSSYTTHLQKR